MWIVTINYQISGMPTTLLYRISGQPQNMRLKLYNNLKKVGGKLGYAVSQMSYEEFEGYFDDEGAAMFGEFEIRSIHPNDEHNIA